MSGERCEESPRGSLGLVVGRVRDVLVGAWAVAPLAGEWIHQAVPVPDLQRGVRERPRNVPGEPLQEPR